MKSNIIAAAILAVGLVVAAFIYKGRYYVLIVDSGTMVRVDRWTGEAKVIETVDGWVIERGAGANNSN